MGIWKGLFNIGSGEGGSGSGTGWDGAVTAYANLPTAASNTNKIYMVYTTTGIPLISRKERGLYRSDGSSWTRLGDWAAIFADDVFEMWDNLDTTKKIQWQLSGITTGNTRVITMADSDIDLSDISKKVPATRTINGYDLSVDRVLYRHDVKPNYRKYTNYEIEFLTQETNTNDPFYGAAVSSGTTAVIASEANHPGVVKFRSSTSANSGYMWGTRSSVVLVNGSESMVYIFKQLDISTDVTFIGLHNSTTVADPTNGVFAKIAGNTLTGYAIASSSSTATSSSYTISNSIWYRLHIDVNSDATLVTLRLYNSETGELVWTDTVASNIPTGAGQELANRVLAVSTGTSATDMLYLDYVSFYQDKTLTR